MPLNLRNRHVPEVIPGSCLTSHTDYSISALRKPKNIANMPRPLPKSFFRKNHINPKLQPVQSVVTNDNVQTTFQNALMNPNIFWLDETLPIVKTFGILKEQEEMGGRITTITLS